MGKQRLVVIGNGMAGARAVEEVLARGGAERSTITMFGDEPYGNYNRILLSNVLSGAQDPSEIFLNTLAWYERTASACTPAHRVTAIDRAARRVYAGDEVGRAVRQAADRHRQPGRSSRRSRASTGAPASCAPACSPSARSTTATASSAAAKPAQTAVVIGGGLLGPGGGARAADPRLRGARRPSGTPPDGAAARRGGRRDAAGAHGGHGRHGAPARSRPPRCWATDAVDRARLQGRRHAGLRHGGDLRRHPAQRRDRRCAAG